MAADSQPKFAEAAAWYRHSAHRALWALAQFLPLLVVVFILLLRSSATDPKPNLARSEAALKALDSEVAPADDAAPEYAVALKLAVAFVPVNQEPDPLSIWNDRSESFANFAAESFWKANAAVISQLKEAVKKPKCSAVLRSLWSRGSGASKTMVPVPRYDEMWHCAQFLMLDARMRAMRGDHVGAAESLHALMNLIRQLDRTDYSRSNADSIMGCGHDALAAILIFNPPANAAAARAYRAALYTGRDSFAGAEAQVKFEFICQLWTLDDFAASSSRLFPARQPFPLMSGNYCTFSQLAYGSDRRCFENCLNDITASLRAGKFPPSLEKLLERNQNGAAPVSADNLRFLRSMAVHPMHVAEHCRLLDAALAVLEFRADTGRDPRKLEELVPRYLKIVPNSILSGKPLQMQRFTETVDVTARSPRCYFEGAPALGIYSLGENGIDDYGTSVPVRPEQNVDDPIVIIPAKDFVRWKAK